MERFKTIILLTFIVVMATNAQKQHALGSLEDDEAYAKMPMMATRTTRDYVYVPERYSLKKYCPTPKDQGDFSTCVSWATAYAARSIAENVNHNWTDRNTKEAEAFSPSFIYALIKKEDDLNCSEGAFSGNAMDALKYIGALKFSQFNKDCADYIPTSLRQKASQHRIDWCDKLFDEITLPSYKIGNTKLAISQNCPVVISFLCYSSFSYAKDLWDGQADNYRGGHAMCVVGYDDYKYGGAFLVMNSWGTDWGNGGFTWITYADYCKFVRYAFALYVKKREQPKPAPKPNPQPTPKPQPKPSNDPTPVKPVQYSLLAGSIDLQLINGLTQEKMPAGLISNTDVPYYKIQGEYFSGNRYRIYISNDAPAFVYVISSDLQNNVEKLFPSDGISPALLNKSNHIALPNENSYIYFGDVKGKDYLCVLYSTEELPIKEILSKIKNKPGNFYEKVKRALDVYLIPKEDISFQQTEISFKAKTTQKVLPIIAEITHN